jgi:hypothetical protein
MHTRLNMRTAARLGLTMMMIGLATAAGPQTTSAMTTRQPATSPEAMRTLSFAGYSWGVKSAPGLLGPGPNIFSDSPSNVWVDSIGQLHLRITYRDGRWQCAEVFLDRSLGYGTYSFTVASPLSDLDPNVTLGLFTWDDSPAYNHREIDIEFARWGNAGDPTNAQYVVQPYGLPGNLTRFVQPLAAPSTHSFTWARKSVTFASTLTTGRTIAGWRYSGRDVPRAGAERTHINLWLNNGAPPRDGAEREIVLSSFSFSR